MSNQPNDFPARLRRQRLRNGYTQAELGELLGVNHTTVAQWERGRGLPNRRNAEKLRRRLAIDAPVRKRAGGGAGRLMVEKKVYLHTDQLAAIRRQAEEHGVSVSCLVRRGLEAIDGLRLALEMSEPRDVMYMATNGLMMPVWECAWCDGKDEVHADGCDYVRLCGVAGVEP
jgi:transcriptional regulator with XRE-family HTH domain